MEIKVLGAGCAKCKSLEKTVHTALSELEITADVEKVEDIQRIIGYGIITTPALVVNGKVVVRGSVPSLKDIKDIIQKNS